MSGFYSLPVSEVNRETPNAVSITFTIPDELKDIFSFKAGQYITIKHTIDDTELRRAYSICCAPDSGKLKVGVKKVEKGLFSVFANTKLKVGDTLEVFPPEGKFVFDPKDDEANSISNHYAAFVAGSGITPVLSIVKTVLNEMPDSTFLLVYGNQSLSETMFHSEILALQKKYKDRLFVEFIYSRKLENEALFGRIERSTVNLLLKNKFKDRTFNSFYLCGPEPMIDEVSSTLKENGINEKQILFELFNTAEKGLLTKKHEGDTQVTITLDDEVETFSMPQKKSVLEAALDHDLDPPYSCQGGICSTCIARITEGKAEMRKNQILTDDEIADGLILTCQAHPTTATLSVDYDDV
ncbi:MAG TPA: flavodoxin reductase [Flavobacteriaceae bacterium]|jgi:ring-1,2-phenylacetyl-CoA epoxidase subunit PaaE|nr:flavodoxin reductase [Flavobacteriaceae bacterium]|tara:strand:+ start:85832 stop:86893 length:1062 start_codon:yes stop_codon:yes gene_type:complete